MFQIIYEVENPRTVKLYIPVTSKVKVTWLNQNAALSDGEWKSIFPDAIITYVVNVRYTKIISYSYKEPQRPY